MRFNLHNSTVPVRAGKVGALVVLALVVTLAACSKQETKAAGPAPSVPVVVATAQQQNVPLLVSAIGTVQPYTTVQVKSMVSAQIEKVGFTQGQDVKKGQLLFSLDKRSFQADLSKAQGTLARDKASAENARVEARRYAALLKEGVVAQQQYDQMQSQAAQMEATVEADQAAVEAAKVSLQYTNIYSPVDGRAGDVLVHEGNLVKANDVPLVVINQVQPIYVEFNLPEQSLAEVKKYMATNKPVIEAQFPNSSDVIAKGSLSFIDNTVDRQTGTIALKGTFANADRKLWPGQFVNVAMQLTTLNNVVTIPSQAVQSGQQGTYVLIVKPDKTAEARPVTLDFDMNGKSVIKSGVNAGEVVITDGQMRVAPGTKVDARSADAPQQATPQGASQPNQPTTAEAKR
jgi:membrane fusion protein, multidrug efflux system